jgi:hypothetical protein
VSRSDLVDKIDETGCCDRLFVQVWCMVGALVHGTGFVQVWCMVDALVHGTGFVQVWCMVDALVHGTGFVQVGAWLMDLFMVQVDYMLIDTSLQQYISK